MSKSMIILVGPPGSGKSTLAKQYEAEGFVRVSQDDQGVDHMHVFDMAAIEGKNIVVDRMNFNKEQRKRYLTRGKDFGYETAIVVLHQPRKVCFERAVARTDHPTIKDERAANSALNTFFSKYERPTSDEADYVNFLYPAGAKEAVVVCDLDGTLCNLDHRLHFVKREGKKDWKSFFENLSGDDLHEGVAYTIDALREKDMTVVFASGRPDDYKRQTVEWLTKNGFSTTHLYMRCRGDHRPDFIAKEIILDFEILTRFKPLFFLDDRDQVVEMWRKRGFVCFQVAKGDF
jgi:predicted kinase